MREMAERQLGLAAGCSALAWDSQEGFPLWGRNYDFDRLAQGSGMTFLPRGLHYFGVVSQEGTFAPNTAAYACAGVGLAFSPTPVLYEGINEKGLMGGQLYYRGFAQYQGGSPGDSSLQPPFLVYHLLAQCATVEEAVHYLEKDLELKAIPMLGTVPPLHWSFRDRTGETIVVEPDRDGLHIYRRTLGVMTNSPSYPWHTQNLLNYAGIRDLDYPTVELEGAVLDQCFSGSGAQGLPGDWSSPSRFVRLAFLKKHALKGTGETQAVSRMFRLFQSAVFPLGMVRVSHQSPVTGLDKDILPFDFTVYTSVYCAQSTRAYWTTYENQRVRYVDLSTLKDRKEPFTLPLADQPDFQDCTPPLSGEDSGLR